MAARIAATGAGDRVDSVLSHRREREGGPRGHDRAAWTGNGAGDGKSAVLAVFNPDAAPVRFEDLTAQCESGARTAFLGRVEEWQPGALEYLVATFAFLYLERRDLAKTELPDEGLKSTFGPVAFLTSDSGVSIPAAGANAS